MTLARDLERELGKLGSRERAVGAKAYLKSDLDFIGVTAPVLRKTVKTLERAAPLEHATALFATVDQLWKRGVFELKAAGVELMMHRNALVTSASLTAIGKLLGDAHTWALVDPISTDVVGAVYDREPGIAKTLDAWAKHPDFWIRRAAMLAHMKALRRGEGDWPRFARYADAMLDEREFFIRKAIGWVLRETSKRRPELVAAWLEPRVGRASGVTWREAVKYLPAARVNALTSARNASG